MLDPTPGSPPVTNLADGPWWLGALGVVATAVSAWLPFHYGRKGVKPATPAQVAEAHTPPPQAAPVGARVVVDLPKPVTVNEGSPEWLIVHMVNNLERRVDDAERRAEESEREAQKRYDLQNKRWQDRYDAQERRANTLQTELFEARGELRASATKIATLEAEVHTLRGQLKGRS